MQEQYKSLFEFLGRAAGGDLGAKVAAAAATQGIQLQEQHISNPKYTGKVLTYPVSFLENYFNGNNNSGGKQLLLDHQDLPF
jgi:hypothetical protein